MVSTVLRSRGAVQVNIEIMRAFVRLRHLLRSNDALARRLASLERRMDSHGGTFGQRRISFDVSTSAASRVSDSGWFESGSRSGPG
jgi:hypothetical protein